MQRCEHRGGGPLRRQQCAARMSDDLAEGLAETLGESSVHTPHPRVLVGHDDGVHDGVQSHLEIALGGRHVANIARVALLKTGIIGQVEKRVEETEKERLSKHLLSTDQHVGMRAVRAHEVRQESPLPVHPGERGEKGDALLADKGRNRTPEQRRRRHPKEPRQFFTELADPENGIDEDEERFVYRQSRQPGNGAPRFVDADEGGRQLDRRAVEAQTGQREIATQVFSLGVAFKGCKHHRRGRQTSRPQEGDKVTQVAPPGVVTQHEPIARHKVIHEGACLLGGHDVDDAIRIGIGNLLIESGEGGIG